MSRSGVGAGAPARTGPQHDANGAPLPHGHGEDPCGAARVEAPKDTPPP